VSAAIKAVAAEEPATWAYTPENRAKVDARIKKYPPGRQASAVLYCLDLAQRQHGWVPQAAIAHIAGILEMAPIRVTEVASFYTMINRKPVGKFLLQVCGTTPCWLCGSNDVFAAIKEETGAGIGQTSADGLFTVMEVECLGACVNAPVVQVNDDYYEDLTKENVKAILRKLKAGETPKPGPQGGRHSTEPAGGALTLTSIRS
jgi:NADH-quinone oxidoreductase subunit E/NADH dehydrogenase (ubiquinone) flavoprotein 2